MTHPCDGHSCDHCFVCDHIGVCCSSLTQAEKDALFASGGVVRSPVLQARLAELRREWGDFSRLLSRGTVPVHAGDRVRPLHVEPVKPSALPPMGSPRALPSPQPSIDVLSLHSIDPIKQKRKD
jgi:hypothetical protein